MIPSAKMVEFEAAALEQNLGKPVRAAELLRQLFAEIERLRAEVRELSADRSDMEMWD